MTGIVALDIVIGLVFVYLLYSLLATIILEVFASYRDLRARMLEEAIIRMLEDEKEQVTGKIKIIFTKIWPFVTIKNGKNGDIPLPNNSFSKEFYDHPLIKFLGKDKRHPKPSYIKNSTFSKVIIDILKGKEFEVGSDIKSQIERSIKLGKTKWSGEKTEIFPETKLFLTTLWKDAQGDVDKFKTMLENWFDETMERASGWYKKHTQRLLFIIGLVLALIFNIDTIMIAEKLSQNPKLREQIVQQANAFLKEHPNVDQELKNQKASNQDSIKQLKQRRDFLLTKADSLLKVDLSKTNGLLGLGYNSACKWYKLSCLFKNQDCHCFHWWFVIKALIGWVLTALAISLGAPFWFDLLNKLVKIRSSVQAITTETAPEKATKEETVNPVG
jgi:hypothetical protein